MSSQNPPATGSTGSTGSEGGASRGFRAPKRLLAAVVLGFEALVVVFAALVAMAQSDVGRSTALTVGLGLAAACVVAAGMVGRPVGYAVGWVLQVLVLATGFWVPMMYLVGAIFAGLWVLGLRTGSRIESERAEFAARSGLAG